MGIPEFQSRDAGGMLGRSIGQGFSRGFEPAFQTQYQRGLLHKGLEKARTVASSSETTPLNTLFSTLEALAGIPGSERYTAQILPEIIKHAQASASQNAPVAGQRPGGGQPGVSYGTRQPQTIQSSPMTQQGKPIDLSKPVTGERIFPENVGPQQQVGNLPQEATSGVKVPVFSNEELIDQARELAQKNNEAGIPTTVPQALEQLKANNQENIQHNSLIDQEREARTSAQKKYGEMGVEELSKYFKDDKGEITANPEVQSLFREKGIELANRGQNDAEIRTSLAAEAKNLKNTIFNVDKQLSAPRLLNTIGRKFMGTYSDFESGAKALREKVQPLLEKGQYDLTRNLLEKKGYYPEEREMIINPLDERTVYKLDNMSKNVRPKTFGNIDRGNTSLEQMDNLKNNIVDVFNNSPNASLVLLRKKAEDKGYNWRVFRDSISELSHEKKIQLNEDQLNQTQYLDSPPLNDLEKLLQGINLIGR